MLSYKALLVTSYKSADQPEEQQDQQQQEQCHDIQRAAHAIHDTAKLKTACQKSRQHFCWLCVVYSMFVYLCVFVFSCVRRHLSVFIKSN